MVPPPPSELLVVVLGAGIHLLLSSLRTALLDRPLQLLSGRLLTPSTEKSSEPFSRRVHPAISRLSASFHRARRCTIRSPPSFTRCELQPHCSQAPCAPPLTPQSRSTMRSSASTASKSARRASLTDERVSHVRPVAHTALDQSPSTWLSGAHIRQQTTCSTRSHRRQRRDDGPRPQAARPARDARILQEHQGRADHVQGARQLELQVVL